MSKEILWFHSVIWPAMLMSIGLPVPQSTFTHGWLTVDGHKMSKSVGNVVNPITLADTYGTDAVRYYLIKAIPFGKDGDFSEKDMVARINGELADDLGNLVLRIVTLILKYCNGNIPACSSDRLNSFDKTLVEKTDILKTVTEHFDNVALHCALEKIWTLIRDCNKYLQETTPWSEKDSQRRNAILYVATETLRVSACYLLPFIPQSATAILKCLGQVTNNSLDFSYTTGGEVQKPGVLFKKHEYTENPFSHTLLRVGKILSVENHPKADRLYVLKIDVGTEERQLVAGIKKWYTPEQLLGRKLVLITNLKYAKIRGVESQGMLLTGEHEDTVELLDPGVASPGEIVTIPGLIHSPHPMTIDEFFKLDLQIKNGAPCYDGTPLVTASGPITSSQPDGSVVK